ncbi:MAG: radical SAM protein [Alphaproteobacteria bacterium]|nr:radical SAM protein [Alphaproteobacteria bacterium]
MSELYARLAGGAAPEDLAEALVRLGEQHRARGERAEAEAAYQAALSLSPHAGAFEGLGLIGLTENPSAATPLLERALEAYAAQGQAAEAATCEGNLGTAAWLLGDLPGAEARFRAARARRAEAGLPPDPLQAVNLARCLAGQGHPEQALPLAWEALRGAGASALVEGMAALTQGELLPPGPERRASLERAAARLPLPAERARALSLLAGERQAAGEHAGAAEAWTQALPALQGLDRVEVLVALGGTRYLLGALHEAAALLDEAAAQLPEAARDSSLERRLRLNRGIALTALGRLDEALPDLDRALGLTEDAALRARTLSALVDARRYAGDLAGAIAAQTELAAQQRAGAAPDWETGSMYAPVEDRGLNLSLAAFRRAGPAPGQGPVLLVCPPAWGASGPLFPRGAASIASFLEHHSVPARVLPLAAWLPHGADVRRHRAQVERVLADAIRAYRPRALGLSVTFSYLWPQGLLLAELLGELAPELPLLVGGPHVTYQDREALEESPALDVVIRGEGEWSALETLQALAAGADLSGIEGITWRAPDGSIHREPKRKLGDVRALPPVDFSLLPAQFCHEMDITALTSRGCAFRCRFCHEFRYWGGVVREHPIARVTGEMQRLRAYGNQLQGIDDSMLDMTTPYFMELVEALGRSDDLSDNFGLLTRLDTINDAGARAMKAAGLRWVMMGAESGSQVVLDAMNKGLRVEQIIAGLHTAKDAGLSTSAFFILGHPGDNEDETARSLGLIDTELAAGSLDWADASTFTPYPGTPFYSNPERHGVRILSRDWSLWRRTNRPVAELEHYRAPEIYANYLRLLEIQDRHLKQRRARVAPPPLGSGSAAG